MSSFGVCNLALALEHLFSLTLVEGLSTCTLTYLDTCECYGSAQLVVGTCDLHGRTPIVA